MARIITKSIWFGKLRNKWIFEKKLARCNALDALHLERFSFNLAIVHNACSEQTRIQMA